MLLIFLKRLRIALVAFTGSIIFYLGLIAFLALLFDVGFPHSEYITALLYVFYAFCIKSFLYLSIAAFLLSLVPPLKIRYFFSSSALILFLLATAGANYMFPVWMEEHIPFLLLLRSKYVIYFTIALVFFAELGKKSLKLHKLNIHPARLFIYGFLFIILAGAALLLLPNATVNGIGIVDALFTSTSAVCVTGLIVVDTATHFTVLGKTIILILIQAGGLGIMTFTSFFGFFFTGYSSFRDQLFLKDFLSAEKMNEVFTLVFRIVFLTLLIEGIGAYIIYYQTPSELFPAFADKVKFSVFHSISAFCNAGFSTLPEGMYDINFRFNYSLHLVFAMLIILGGLGFPIVFNFFSYIKQYIKSFLKMIFLRVRFEHVPRLININTKLVVGTSFFLLVAGTLAIYFFDFNNVLYDAGWGRKIITAFFCSVTARTAGFNTIDFSTLTHGSILFIIFLMWVGGSPGSTAGGIKTTTLAVAVLNAISIAKGKDRVEIFRREISGMSVKRAHAILFLSLFVIGFAFFLLSVFEPEQEFLPLLFETFSAFSTVGLSLGITGNLSDAGKLILIALMFAGRVGTLTILVAFIRKVKTVRYRYPSEGIFIN